MIKLKNIRFINIVAMLISIGVSILLFISQMYSIDYIYNALEITVNQYNLYVMYYIVSTVNMVSVVFGLLSISSSLRENYIYFKLKWSGIVSIGLSLGSLLLIDLLKYSPQYTNVLGLIQIYNPLLTILYVLEGVGVGLMVLDLLLVYFKNKNNPFYRDNLKKQMNQRGFYYRRNPATKESDGSITPGTVEGKVDETKVVEEDLSYFEIYEKRKKEIDELNELYYSGKIDLEEYNLRRKEIYKKYDKYN